MKAYRVFALSLVVTVGLLLVFSGQATALLLNSSTGEIIAAPDQVLNDLVTNEWQQAFNEKQNVTLTEALEVDGGFIAAGTVVSSHMIFLNTPWSSPVTADQDTWDFDGAILGVMSDSNGNLEAASSTLLGFSTTEYPPTGFPARGMEGSKTPYGNDDWYLASGNQLEVFMRVTEPGDWIRVITASTVPEPTTMLLVGLGLLGLGIIKKRK